ncbi:MAG: YggS family pyridoxal phosphate-dependent enzyme [Gammaproteobacteria bacterium]|nr:YggS family pyridoxal phosphate-dependent enzyme [Gammaproteobacteria bacterium]MCW9004166.1 YggS family pyridoxal phosphate-dependent enzyme [Gammaproteobacteria bacterium]MCW9055513.1 YggS family pyridoxal phosphate-dependent enzyme [Gammaproteobacteria bacterium]
MPNPTVIAENINQINNKIAEFAAKYQRQANDITLLAVSKTMPVDDIQAAYEAGQKDFGENYLQEALVKIQSLQHPDITWHFIGAIQSNKTREIANAFNWVHSIERIKIARRLNEQRNPELAPLNVCLQINISDENTKAGIQYNELTQLAREITSLPNLKLRGLMAIPAKTESFDEQRSIFRKMHQIMNELNQLGFNMDTLSMGMSNDMEAAIAEGATIVRIGTSIFGSRTQNQP